MKKMIRKGLSPDLYTREIVGGKGHNLLRLSRIADATGNFRVPNFTILPVGFREEAPIDLREVYDGLKKPLAVRSSSPWEDSRGLSFAGRFNSFLDIDDYHSFSRAIDGVLESAMSSRALGYAKRHNIKLSDRMAVIVQEMVEPEISGVCYSTANETDQRTIIEFLKGLSDELMSGTKQGSMVIFDENLGLMESYDCERKFVPRLREIASVSRKLDDTYGYRLDVEFAVSKDGIPYLVQTRPVTDPEWPSVLIPDMENERILLSSDIVRGSGIFRGPIFVFRSPDEMNRYCVSRNLRPQTMEQYQWLRDFNSKHGDGYCLLADTLEVHQNIMGEGNLTNMKALVTVNYASRFSHPIKVVSETGAFYIGTRGRDDVMDLVETGDTISVASNQLIGVMYDHSKPVVERDTIDIERFERVPFETALGMRLPPYEEIDDRYFPDKSGRVGIFFWDYNEVDGVPDDVFYDIVADGEVLERGRYQASRTIFAHHDFPSLLMELLDKGRRKIE